MGAAGRAGGVAAPTSSCFSPRRRTSARSSPARSFLFSVASGKQTLQILCHSRLSNGVRALSGSQLESNTNTARSRIEHRKPGGLASSIKPLGSISFHGPNREGSGRIDMAGAGARYPAWVLLHREAYFAADQITNATSAEARTSTGHTIRVTFHLASPPAVSYFCVDGPELRREDFKRVPEVLSAEKHLVLLRFALASGPRIRSYDPYRRGSADEHLLDECLLYTAGKPSLRPIPFLRAKRIDSICILPSDDGEEFLLAAFVSTCDIMTEDLCIFSSKTGSWSSCRHLELTRYPDMNYDDIPVRIDRVIALGGGQVGLVDLFRGIKVCNVLEEDDNVLRFIPLPKPEFDQGRSGSARQIRDVVFSNGVIEFVEIDRRFRQVLGVNNDRKYCKKMTNDLDNTDVIYDSEMLVHNYSRVEPMPVPDGWKIRTCHRHTCWDYWRKGHVVDVDDLHDSMPELSDGNDRKWALKDLTTAYPTLSIFLGDDVVYLMLSKVKSDDEKAWMIGLHLGKKTLEILEPYSASYFKSPKFLACAFSEYLNTTPSSVSSTLLV